MSYHFKYIWPIKHRILHPYLRKKDNDPSKLRLILGLARSGTTWIANTLARTKTPIRYLEEPLYAVRPDIRYAPLNDKTSLSYQAPKDYLNNLVVNYHWFTNKKLKPSYFTINKIKRNDINYGLVLIKEVHALMATRFLAKNLQCPIILLKRNPFNTLDSVIQAQGLYTIFYVNEYKYLQSVEFLHDFFTNKETDILIHAMDNIIQQFHYPITLIYQKVLSYAITNMMFDRIAAKQSNCLTVRYEDLIDDPNTHFRKLANFIGFDYENGSYQFNDRKTNNPKYDPYDITQIITDHQKYKTLRSIELRNKNEICNWFVRQLINIEKSCFQQ